MGRKDKAGAMLVELVMVMLLLALFGVTIYTMIISGADTQERVVRQKDAQTDARIALSYINVRLRQNDSGGKIFVEPLELTGQNAIVIRTRTFDYEYDTWIYCLNGRLYECLTDPGSPPTEELSFHIVDIEGFEPVLNDDGSIVNTVNYLYGEAEQNLSSTIYLRSTYTGGWFF
ncbi:MAG: DUF4860 domain-containing protein [Clostridiales bacterium]|nr:DUF4860 domain-containing protein [Clostridiales bacterium]